MIIFPNLHSLLYTTNPQATTYSTYSRSGFSCSPMRKPFSSEPLNLFSEPDPYIFFPLLPSCISAALFFNPYFLFSTILFLSSLLHRTRMYMCPSFSSSPPSSKACLCLSALTTKPAFHPFRIFPPTRPDATLPPHTQTLSVNRSPSARLRRPKGGRSSITTRPFLQDRPVPFCAETLTLPFSGTLTGVHTEALAEF
jgi:hypothetical protein